MGSRQCEAWFRTSGLVYGRNYWRCCCSDGCNRRDRCTPNEMSLGLWAAICAVFGAFLRIFIFVRRPRVDEQTDEPRVDEQTDQARVAGVALIAPAAALLGSGLA